MCTGGRVPAWPPGMGWKYRNRILTRRAIWQEDHRTDAAGVKVSLAAVEATGITGHARVVDQAEALVVDVVAVRVDK